MLGITLITVPYWWDRKISSFAATIYTKRPELFSIPPLGKPIPTTPLSDYIKHKTSSTIYNYL